MKKVCIIGANSFIGHHLVNFLSQYDFDVFAVIRKKRLPVFLLKKNVQVYFADVTDKESLKKVIHKDAIVINLAANPYHKSLSYQVNVEGVNNLIEVIKENRAQKLVQISSQATKLERMGVYGTTKKMADEIIVNSKVDYIILKPSLVYGEGQTGLFSRIKNQLDKLPIIPIFGPKDIRINPIFIDDLVKIIKLVIDDRTLKNKIFEPGSLDFISYKNFYRKIAGHLDKKIYTIYLPAFLGILIAKVFSLFKNPPFYVDNVLGSSQNTNPDPSSLLKMYNYQPLTLNKGLQQILSPNKIKIAIIGLGKMGILHSSILSSMTDVKIVALIEPNKEIHPTIRSLGLGANIYSSLENTLRKESIDAIYVCTPTFTHFDLINQALKNNLHIFIEKPVCLNSKQLIRLKRFKPNLVMRAGYTLLFKRTFLRVKEIIDQKKYGEIKSFKAIFEHSEVLSKKDGWMFKKNLSGGGVLMNPGPHLFSLIHLFFGLPLNIKSNLKKIHSEEVEDQAHVELDYRDFKGTAYLNWSAQKRPLSYYSIQIDFEKASIVVGGNSIVINTFGKRKLIILEKDIPTQLNSIFNINPEANGEAYFLEDRLFISEISQKRSIKAINSLDQAIEIESIIQSCYN